MSHCLLPCITVALRQLHKQMHLAVSAIPPYLADPDVNGASGLSSRKSVTHHEYMSLDFKEKPKRLILLTHIKTCIKTNANLHLPFQIGLTFLGAKS